MKIPARAGKEKEMEPQIIRLQLALIFQDIIRNPNLFMEELTSELDLFKDSNPNFIMHPSTIPPVVPIGTLMGTNKMTSLSATGERIDFICYNVPNIDKNVKDVYDKNVPIIIDKVLSKKSIGRIGFISTIFREDKNPNNYIEKNYTNHSIIKDTTEIFVRYNNPYKYKNILINKLTNIESPFKPFPDNDTIGWSITKDINTSFRDDGLSKKFVLDLYSKIKDYLCS